jgi:protein O-mannosyl-transferase
MTLKPATNELPSRALAWRIVGAALLASATIVAYWPALHGQFILDDNILLTDSAMIDSTNGLAQIWFSTKAPDFTPLSNTTLWLEWRLRRLNPTGYHVTNLALHVASALLLWAILRKLSIPGAYLAALLFALHPVNVESVAWIAQRRNVLALFFALLSICCWLKLDISLLVNKSVGAADDREPPAVQMTAASSRWYWFSLLAFVLAMLSKGSVAMLPAILLLLDWWRRGRISKNDLLRTALFWAVAISLVLMNIWYQARSGIVFRQASAPERLAGAGAVVWFYLAKAVAPFDLSFVYPKWQIEIANLRWWLPLTAALAATALLIWRRNRWWGQGLLFAWLFFGLSLVPVMGFTDVGFMWNSLVADHYQHIAIIAVVVLAGAAWSAWNKSAGTVRRIVTSAVAAVVVLCFADMTFHQSDLYAGPFRLYEDTLSKNPDSSLAHNNLGVALAETGESQQAIKHYLRALELNPKDWEAHCNLANAQAKVGNYELAIEHYRRAVAINPDCLNAAANPGATINDATRASDPLNHIREAIRLGPDRAESYNHLGMALASTGKLQETINSYRRALELDATHPTAHFNLANAFARIGQSTEAIAEYRKAIELRPRYVEARNNLAAELVKIGQRKDAIAQFQQVVELEPESPRACFNLGSALSTDGQTSAAIEEFEKAASLKGDYVECYANLAACYADINRPTDALAKAKIALSLAQSQGRPELAEKITKWIEEHQAKSN